MSDDIELDGDTPISEGPAIDHGEEHGDLSGRETLRVQLQNDVEMFLAQGGRINEIEPNVIADPPKKPQSNYGGQPI